MRIRLGSLPQADGNPVRDSSKCIMTCSKCNLNQPGCIRGNFPEKMRSEEVGP